MILAKIDGRKKRMVNKSSFTENLSNLLGTQAAFPQIIIYTVLTVKSAFEKYR